LHHLAQGAEGRFCNLEVDANQHAEHAGAQDNAAQHHAHVVADVAPRHPVG
jgi:hypothetical protein